MLAIEFISIILRNTLARRLRVREIISTIGGCKRPMHVSLSSYLLYEVVRFVPVMSFKSSTHTNLSRSLCGSCLVVDDYVSSSVLASN